MAKNKYLDPADALLELGERVRASASKPNIFRYKPHDKQQLFHNADKKIRLYIGGNRSGKTVGGICEDIFWLQKDHPNPVIQKLFDTKWKYEPIRGRICSVDFLNGVEKTIIPQIVQWLPPSMMRGGSWSEAFDTKERVLHLENGGFVEFMSYDQDLDKFSGTSRHFVHFDEEPPEDIYKECAARVVDTGGFIWFTMTPVEGLTWLYDDIYEPAFEGNRDDVALIEVDMEDNPYIEEEQRKAFISLLNNEDDVAVRVHGKFVSRGGLIYPEFSKEKHVLSEDWLPPKDWLWVASLDHGFTNPTAWLWHAISPEGRIVTFYEYYKSGLVVSQHAANVHQINQKLGRPPDYYVGDPSIQNSTPISGTSVLEEYVKYGIPIILGNNDVEGGIIRVAGYLRREHIDSVTGNVESLWSVTPNCTSLIWEMQRYRWAIFQNRKTESEHNKKETPRKKDDHACDSLRYFIMSRPDFTSGVAPDSRPVNFLGSSTTYAQTVPNSEGQVVPNARREVDWELVGATTTTNRDLNSADGQWITEEYMGGEW